MPLQNILVAEAHQRIAAANDPDVVAMPVGQIVGRMNAVRPVAELFEELLAEFDRRCNASARSGEQRFGERGLRAGAARPDHAAQPRHQGGHLRGHDPRRRASLTS